MARQEMKEILLSMLEELADIEHERWSHWQRYLHGKGVVRSDGSMLLPSKLVEQWSKQMQTRYADLSEKEKESDREQVRVYLDRIVDRLQASGSE